MSTPNAPTRFGLEAQHSIQSGLALLERALGPTLGPHGATVGVTQIGRPSHPPDLLEDGATIARRLIGVHDPYRNVGLMLGRQAAIRQRQGSGDGAATAVVLAAAAHRGLVKQLAADDDTRSLLAGVERALEQAQREIGALSRPLEPDDVRIFLAGSLDDEALISLVGDVVARIGSSGTITTRDAPHSDIRAQYVEGSMWETDVATVDLLEGAGRADVALADPRILLWDGALEDAPGLAGLLERCLAERASSLLVLARSFTPAALALLVQNSRGPIRLAAVDAPFAGEHQHWAFDDIAALTATRVFGPTFADRIDAIAPDKFGVATRAVIGRRFLNISAVHPRSARVEAQRASVARQLALGHDDSDVRALRERLGRLDGGMAIIWVGGLTDHERAIRRHRIDESVGRLGAALRSGVVPGAGAAYTIAASRLCVAGETSVAAIATLRSALAMPAWWIARNAGMSTRSDRSISATDHGIVGIDARTGRSVDLVKAGIVEPTDTVLGALRVGASTATLAASAAGVVWTGGADSRRRR